MTDLDWPPNPPEDVTALERLPKTHPHTYARTIAEVQRWGVPIGRCRYCERTLDEATARRGKSARRLGHDTERRIEKLYGPEKIGERGDPVDHLGRVWRWQAKATRSLPPKWLVKITEPSPPGRTLPIALRAAHKGMEGLYGGRLSVVIRSFVHTGTRTRDWLFIDAKDAYQQFNQPEGGYIIPWWIQDPGWYVIPGDWWLDHFGRDE